MSTTTAADLLARGELLSRELQGNGDPVTAEQWAAFDVTLHRLLTEVLGVHGSRVPEQHATLKAVIDQYPRPLTGPIHHAHSDPIPLLRPGGIERPPSFATRRGHLQSVPDEKHDGLPALDVEALPEATDPHPLARLTCTFGALADLLHGHHRGEHTPPDLDGINDATRRILAIGAVAARHALAHTLADAPLTDVERPLTVGRHAEACLAALEPCRPGVAHWLHGPAAVHVGSAALSPSERLDIAVAAWVRASETEMRAAIPSLDCLRTLARQSTHLLATAHAVLSDGVEPPHPATQATKELREALTALVDADQAWPNAATTLARPAHAFVAASRELHEALEPLRLAADDLDATERVKSAAGIMRATSHLSRQLTSARDFPERLACSGLLFAPARTLITDLGRLGDRKHGRHIPAALDDIRDFIHAWHDTVDHARNAHLALAHHHPSPSVALSPSVTSPSL